MAKYLQIKFCLTLLSLGFFNPCKSGRGAFCGRSISPDPFMDFARNLDSVFIGQLYLQLSKEINMTSFLTPAASLLDYDKEILKKLGRINSGL